MTANASLLNLTKTLAANPLAKPASRAPSADLADPRRFRAALTQESRRAKPAQPQDDAAALATTKEPSGGAPGAVNENKDTTDSQAKGTRRSPTGDDAQSQPQYAQEAAQGKDAPEQAGASDGSAQADPGTSAGSKTGTDGSTEAPAGPQSSNGASASLAAQGVVGVKPLTIRELNRALRSLDADSVPEGLLNDLGISSGGEGDGSASKSLEASTPEDEAAADTVDTSLDGHEQADPRSVDGDSREGDSLDLAVDDGSSGASAPAGAAEKHASTAVGAHSGEVAAVNTREHAAPIPTSQPTGPLSLPGIGALRGLGHEGRVFKLAHVSGGSPAQDPTQADALQQQLSRGMLAAVSSGDKSVTLRLNPESLGPLRIEVEMQGTLLQVRFAAATPETQKKIDEALPSLRETLEKQGMNVGEVSSRLATDAAREGAAQSGQAKDSSNSQTNGHQHTGAGSPDAGSSGSGGGQESPQHGSGHRHSHAPETALIDDLLPADVRTGHVRTLDLINLRLDAVA